MGKPWLLTRLGELQKRAETAHIQSTVLSSLDRLQAKGNEQRLHEEMTWVLDELDKLGR